MSEGEFRTEEDPLGEVEVPASAYWGAQTERARENFQVSDLRFQRRFIRAMAVVKKAAALTNVATGRLDPEIGEAIAESAQEIIDGELYEHFVVDVYQSGAGTSTNMNTNEVIANLANERIGRERGDYSEIHPNDHVNMAQSTNDTIPSAIHIATVDAIENELLPSLEKLASELNEKKEEFEGVLKSGRTHLQDAVPITLGQEFSGYENSVRKSIQRIRRATDSLREIPLGGTAVGTGLNASPEYIERVVEEVSDITGTRFENPENMFQSIQNREAVLETSAALRGAAVSLNKIADDLRLLSSGPNTAIGEIKLPAVQPGSSIMPGKVNPVMAEMLNMVCYQVMGNDATISNAVEAAQLELNVMMPVMAYTLIQSIEILANATTSFVDRCVTGIEAREDRSKELLEKNPIVVTALTPHIGYARASEIGKKAYEENKTVRKVVLEEGLFTEDELDRILDLRKLTLPKVHE